MAENNPKYQEPPFEDKSERDANTTEDTGDNRVEIVKKQFHIWLMGLVVSIIPLLVLPIYHAIISKPFCVIFEDFFVNAEIIFVGISLTIASMNDFVTPMSKEAGSGWMWTNIITILLGTITYGAMVLAINLGIESINRGFVIVFNIIYLVFCFLMGLCKYKSKMNKTR